MALFIRQDDSRSELQERLAAELQARAKERDKIDNHPDGVTDSEYMKNTSQTSSLAWLWILLVVVALGVIIWLTLFNTTG